MALQHVSRVPAEQHPAGGCADHSDHAPRPVEEHDRDRNPHPERVDRLTGTARTTSRSPGVGCARGDRASVRPRSGLRSISKVAIPTTGCQPRASRVRRYPPPRRRPPRGTQRNPRLSGPLGIRGCAPFEKRLRFSLPGTALQPTARHRLRTRMSTRSPVLPDPGRPLDGVGERSRYRLPSDGEVAVPEGTVEFGLLKELPPRRTPVW